MKKALVLISILLITNLFASGISESLSEDLKNDLSQAFKIEISFG